MLNSKFKIQNSKLWGHFRISNLRLLIRNSHKGFTLLELLISIVILVIIILIIAGAMRLGFRSVDAGEKKTESLERYRTSLNIINSQIQSLLPITFSEEGTQQSNFTGSRQSLHFSTNYSIWGVQKGYVEVSYEITSEETGKEVLYASENIMGTECSKEVKLFDTLDEIYFDYFYKDPTEEEGKWIEEWTDTLTLPEKIRLHLINGNRDFAIIIPVRVRVSIAHAKTGLSEGEE
ncbi:MAG: prepilin-type N-terminal cleavage/methylation domain-containing protein [Thermodesulfovibrionales bacterium]